MEDERVAADPEQRERESRESSETKFHEASEQEREDVDTAAERLGEPPSEAEETV